jgi:2-dehydropantoate 2-reductase
MTAPTIERVCIVGAGAIGGWLGARLAAAGRAQVAALARGATRDALREHGWRLDSADGTRLVVPARASDRADELGVQDLVIVAVKSQALPEVARGIAPLLGRETVVLPAMNGVPWWFCAGLDGFQAPLASVDPQGGIASAIAFERVLGCVVHASTAAVSPGHIQQRMGNGLIVGEPRGGTSARAQAVSELLAHAGFDVTPTDDVRQAIWFKLWGNMTMNPVSALTGATLDRVLADPLVRDFCSAAMQEAAAIGARIGCPIAQTPEDRHALTARLGAIRTSMLQDVEAQRAIELDALVGAVREIGQRLGVATPAIDALFGLARLFGRVRGLYPEDGPQGPR